MINLLGKILSFAELHWNAARTAREVSYLKGEVVYHRGEAEAYYSKWSQAEKVANNRLRHIEKLQKELDDYHYRLDCRFCQTKTVCDNCITRNGAKSLCQVCGGLGIDLKPYENEVGVRIRVCGVCQKGGVPEARQFRSINTWPEREELLNRKNRLEAAPTLGGLPGGLGVRRPRKVRELPPGCTNTDEVVE